MRKRPVRVRSGAVHTPGTVFTRLEHVAYFAEWGVGTGYGVVQFLGNRVRQSD